MPVVRAYGSCLRACVSTGTNGDKRDVLVDGQLADIIVNCKTNRIKNTIIK